MSTSRNRLSPHTLSGERGEDARQGSAGWPELRARLLALQHFDKPVTASPYLEKSGNSGSFAEKTANWLVSQRHSEGGVNLTNSSNRKSVQAIDVGVAGSVATAIEGNDD